LSHKCDHLHLASIHHLHHQLPHPCHQPTKREQQGSRRERQGVPVTGRASTIARSPSSLLCTNYFLAGNPTRRPPHQGWMRRPPTTSPTPTSSPTAASSPTRHILTRVCHGYTHGCLRVNLYPYPPIYPTRHSGYGFWQVWVRVMAG
jgi:hypothetical protein